MALTSPVSITDASNTTPVVVTLAAPLPGADELKIAGITGNDGANGAFFARAADSSDTRFELFADKALNEPAAGSGAYTGGGAVYPSFNEDYGIVVGINSYPAFAALRGPEADASSFYKWLVSPRGGLVPLKNVKRILSSDYKPPDPDDFSTWQPALDSLKLAFWKLAAKAVENDKNSGDARVGRRLWVFLSGHGITPAKTEMPDYENAALLAASAGAGRYGEHLTGLSWVRWFKDAAAFDELILLMDCCRDLKNNVSPLPCTLSPALIKDRRSDVRLFYATATDLDSQSWENQIGQVYHGLFSYVLLDALQNDALLDTSGRLTTSQLAHQIRAALPDLIKQVDPGKVQTPRFVPDPPQQILLRQSGTPLPPNLRISFDPALKDQEVTLRDSGNTQLVLDRHTVNGGSWMLRVDPFKLYKLVSAGGRSSLFETAGEVMTDVAF